MPQMPLPVLQPVTRRRRPRPRRFRWAALVLLVAGALVAAGWMAVSHHDTHSAAPTVAAPVVKNKPAPRTKAAPKPKPVAPPPKLVSVAGPLNGYVFAPPLSASGAILVDGATGKVLWAHNPRRRLHIASTTKIMTAILALHRVKLGSLVKIGPEVPRAAPNREGLRAGEKVRAWKLFYGLLLYSGNDDALALAVASSGSRAAFVQAMNDKAKALGMRNSHFSTPSGVVDRDNRSTAWDMAILARYAMQDRRFRAIVATPREEVKWSAPTYAKIYLNKNALLATYPGATGIKTGWTTIARHCLVASATRNHRRLIAVVLHSEDAFTDAKRLLNLGFRIDR